MLPLRVGRTVVRIDVGFPQALHSESKPFCRDAPRSTHRTHLKQPQCALPSEWSPPAARDNPCHPSVHDGSARSVPLIVTTGNLPRKASALPNGHASSSARTPPALTYPV